MARSSAQATAYQDDIEVAYDPEDFDHEEYNPQNAQFEDFEIDSTGDDLYCPQTANIQCNILATADDESDTD